DAGGRPRGGARGGGARARGGWLRGARGGGVERRARAGHPGAPAGVGADRAGPGPRLLHAPLGPADHARQARAAAGAAPVPRRAARAADAVQRPRGRVPDDARAADRGARAGAGAL
ncbi:MAG: hypothetical protein AVDCRST_MAG30-2485, partial [uncultured Solirubrobacteraceae bacterium]